MKSVDEIVEATAFDAFPSTSALEAFDTTPNNPASEVAPDFGIEKESTPPQPVELQAHRTRGRPRRQASHIPLEGVAVMESKRKLRTRKNAEVASESEDPWTNLSKAPLLTPLSPKKPRRERVLQKSQPPVNQTSPLT